MTLTISYREKIYSMDYSINCDKTFRVPKTLEKGCLIYAEVQLGTKLKFWMYEVANTVPALKKSNVYDDLDFATENLRLLKSIYPLNKGISRNIWQSKKFAILVFGDRTLKVTKSVVFKQFTTGRGKIFWSPQEQLYRFLNFTKIQI